MSEAPSGPELMWTTQQVADAFQVTTETVRIWITSGQLKAIKIGNEWRVPQGDLATFTKERYANK